MAPALQGDGFVQSPSTVPRKNPPQLRQPYRKTASTMPPPSRLSGDAADRPASAGRGEGTAASRSAARCSTRNAETSHREVDMPDTAKGPSRRVHGAQMSQKRKRRDKPAVLWGRGRL